MSIYKTSIRAPKLYESVISTDPPYEEFTVLPGDKNLPDTYSDSHRPHEENQDSIDSWALETFGWQGLRTLLKRLEEEFEELKAHVSETKEGEPRTDEQKAKIGRELADLMIVSVQMASRVDVDLAGCVDYKMGINRSRKWIQSEEDGLWRHKK